ncbi:MAG: LysM peptidoglycan-binding domain-containing protein, partial [Flavobacterium sp.]
MKYFAILFFSFLMFSNVAFAQDNYKKHKVVKGETITDIAKKYKVAPYDIYRLNPDSQKGLKEGGILLIPNETKKEPTQPVKEQPTKVANTVHEVEAKETLYSLAKKYNVSVDDIKKANGDSVKDGLRIGQKVIIPIKGSAVAAQVKVVEKEAKKEPPAYFYHTVAAGETKYSIAKQYNMTLQLLEELNPEIKDLLPLNFKLKLDKTAIIAKETEPVANVPVTTPSPVAQEFMIYKVQPKETLYNLTKKTGLTENQILALNPQAKEGLKEGMELKLPKAKAGIVASDTVMAPGMMADLSKSLKKSNSRELALLLPFNMNRVESDTIRMQLLRSDKFLNMTLDFYAGALMAIDSAKVLGLPLKVKILDSKETKNTSDIESLRGSLTSADAVVGPFFQSNVEKTADLLGTGIPVVSPLSKEPGRPYPNLFQSMPPPDKVKMAMLDYLKKKDANVVAVVDPKKASSRVLIKNNYPSARFADGAITAATVKLLLVKDKMNYVIMESESTGMIKNTTK